MSEQAHIAVDLGAGSGRVVVGTLGDGRLALHEVHRFEHEALPTPGGLCWDFTGLWRNILLGLRSAAGYAEAHGLRAASVGVDTWGVDFAWVNDEHVLLGLPRCYRDPAFAAAHARVIERLPAREIYQGTGIQIMPINSLYQYAARAWGVAQPSPAYGCGAASKATSEAMSGRTLLFMPDLFHWMLTGERTTERTIASTSQMVDARDGDWNRPLLEKLGLPTEPLGAIIDPGAVIGGITDEVAEATGLPASVRVVAPPSHDTASAVAGVPAEPGTSWCYLSSGTWSLLGAELERPCVTEAAYEANFTNELGAAGTVRFLKNIAGLWLVQEVRRQLQRQGDDASYAEMTARAAAAEPMRTLIPVNDPAFAAPGRMIDRIRAYAARSEQPVPEGVGQVVRCCLESLALTYRQTLAQLERVLDKRFEVMHVVGGGGKNGLLNRLTAEATGLPLRVGPYEATAAGNVLTQAMGLGRLGSLAEMREVVAASFELERVDPGSAPAPGSATGSATGSCGWDEAAGRFAELPGVEGSG